MEESCRFEKDVPFGRLYQEWTYVFNISGNNFRLVTVVIFIGGVVNIRFIGTHAEYDKIDSATI